MTAKLKAEDKAKVERLNELREKLGMGPTRAVTDNIDERIKKLEERLANGDGKEEPAPPEKNKKKTKKGPAEATKESAAKSTEALDKAIEDTGGKKPKPEAEPTKARKEAAESSKKKKKTGNGGDNVRLGDICKKTGVDGRIARQRLRAAYGEKNHKLPETIGDAWLWSRDDAPKIEAVVKGAE